MYSGIRKIKSTSSAKRVIREGMFEIMTDLIRAYDSDQVKLQMQVENLKDRVDKVELVVAKQGEAHNAFIPTIYSDIGKIQAETNSMKNMVIKLQWSVIGAGILLILNIVTKVGGF